MTSSVSNISRYDPSFKPGRTPSSELDPEAFLQLLVAQLRYQDPLEGMDQNQFMQQLATMSSAQQQYQLNDRMGQLLAADATMKAVALIGHEIKGLQADGQVVSGPVSGVTVTDGKPMLNVGSALVGFDQLTQVS